MENRFTPLKRVGLDGKVWWCVLDNKYGKWSTFVHHGRYKRKWECQWAIDYNNEKYHLDAYK